MWVVTHSSMCLLGEGGVESRDLFFECPFGFGDVVWCAESYGFIQLGGGVDCGFVGQGVVVGL